MGSLQNSSLNDRHPNSSTPDLSAALPVGSFRDTAATSAFFSDPMAIDPRLIRIPCQGKLLIAASQAAQGALFTDGSPVWTRPETIQLVLLSQLNESPWNPRKYCTRLELASLAVSIAKDGLFKPIKICRGMDDKTYILSGHRRLFVMAALGFHLTPVELDPRGKLSEKEVRKSLITYNENHSDLAPVDRARAFARYMGDNQIASVRELAEDLAIPYTKLYPVMTLLQLPDTVLNRVNAGTLPVSTARLLLNLKNPAAQEQMAERIVMEKLSLARVRSLVAGGRRLREGSKNKPLEEVSEIEARDSTDYLFRNPAEPSLSLRVFSVKTRVSREELGGLFEQVLSSLPHEMPVHHAREEVDRTDPAPREIAAQGDEPRIASGEGRAAFSPKIFARGSDVLRSAAASTVAFQYTDGTPDWGHLAQIQLIDVRHLKLHPNRPRRVASKADFEQVKASIQLEGINTPLIIGASDSASSEALIIKGGRRWLAAKQLGFDLVPCLLRQTGGVNEEYAARALIMANENFAKPSPIDRARSYADYKRLSGYPDEIVAAELAVSLTAFHRSLALLKLPTTVQEWITQGRISETSGYWLAQVQGGARAQTAAARKVMSGKLMGVALRDFAKASLPEAAQQSSVVDEHDESSGSTWRWLSPDGLRISVVVSRNNGEISPADVTSVLQQVHQSHLATLRGGTAASAPWTAVEPDLGNQVNPAPAQSTVDLRTLPNAQEASLQRVVRYFSDSPDDAPFSVRSAIVPGLQKQFSERDLKRYGISDLPNTFQFVQERFPEQCVAGKSCSLLGVLMLWGSNLEYLAGVSGNDLSGDVLSRNLIDIRYQSDISVRYSVDRIRDHLIELVKNIEPTLLSSINPLLTAEESAQASLIRARENAAPLVDISKLAESGFVTLGAFSRRFNEWAKLHLPEMRSRPLSADESAFSIPEAKAYVQYCIAKLLDLAAMNTRGIVGNHQLEAAKIPFFGGTVSTVKTTRFSVSGILRELTNNLEVLERHSS